MKISVIIPTRNGGDIFKEAISSICKQSITLHKVIVIDSSSTDLTPHIAKAAGFDVLNISPVDFNHGGTRNAAADFCMESDVIVFLTQDAVLDSPDSLKIIINCFLDPKVSAAYGRQLPHDNANPLAIHARKFNYPIKSENKTALDIPRLGIKTAFMSNSFSAYRSEIFHNLGGFPNNTILAEDMYLTAQLILADLKIAYCAEATVKHSHNYTPWEEFRRYFDTGVFHACEPWIRTQFGGAGGEGMKFIRSELAYLKKHAPLWIPRALLTNVCKLLGYKLGQQYSKLPFWLCKQFSMYKSYWLQNNIR